MYIFVIPDRIKITLRCLLLCTPQFTKSLFTTVCQLLLCTSHQNILLDAVHLSFFFQGIRSSCIIVSTSLSAHYILKAFLCTASIWCLVFTPPHLCHIFLVSLCMTSWNLQHSIFSLSAHNFLTLSQQP